jgi:hypothetical protein
VVVIDHGNRKETVCGWISNLVNISRGEIEISNTFQIHFIVCQHKIEKVLIVDQRKIMTDTEIYDKLDGFYAYDIGCTDSGIKDDKAKTELIAYMGELDDQELTRLLRHYLSEHYLNERQIDKGYTIMDAYEFLCWFNNEIISLS